MGNATYVVCSSAQEALQVLEKVSACPYLFSPQLWSPEDDSPTVCQLWNGKLKVQDKCRVKATGRWQAMP